MSWSWELIQQHAVKTVLAGLAFIAVTSGIYFAIDFVKSSWDVRDQVTTINEQISESIASEAALNAEIAALRVELAELRALLEERTNEVLSLQRILLGRYLTVIGKTTVGTFSSEMREIHINSEGRAGIFLESDVEEVRITELESGLFRSVIVPIGGTFRSVDLEHLGIFTVPVAQALGFDPDLSIVRVKIQPVP